MKRLLIGIMLVVSLTTGSRAAEQPNLPTAFDIVMLAGADYLLTIQVKDNLGSLLVLNVNTYKAQFRSTTYPVGTIFANFSTIPRPGNTTILDVKLSKAQTAALTGRSGVWDLKQTAPTGLVSYIMSGKAVVRPTVTQ